MLDNQTANFGEQYKALCEKALGHHLPRWNDLPEIELYMDQVVAVMERYLNLYTGEQSDDNRIITPSIINNYVKLKVIPPPVRKKYAREHLAYLIIICILKQTLSISTIIRIIELQLKSMDITGLYNSFCETYEAVLRSVISDSVVSFNNDPNSDSAALGDLTIKSAIVSTTGRFVCENLLAFDHEDNQKNAKTK